MRAAHRIAAGIGALVVTAGTAACTSGSSGPSPSPSASVPAVTAAATTCRDGQPVVASLAPASGTDGSTTIAAIRKRGRLIVGTSADAPLWGQTDPEKPAGAPLGFDVALAQHLADDLGPGVGVEYRYLRLADRQPALNRSVDDAGVDLVAERMTITCARWQGTATAPAVNFSTPYYTARQNGLLVHVPEGRNASGIGSFQGRPVCGVTGSSSLAAVAQGGADIVEADTAGQCLVRFVQGDAEAVVGDDTTLAGLQEMSPANTGTRLVQGSATPDVPYGLGLPPGDAAFTAWVNGRLAAYRQDGTLDQLRDQYRATNPAGTGTVETGRRIDDLGRTSR